MSSPFVIIIFFVNIFSHFIDDDDSNGDYFQKKYYINNGKSFGDKIILTVNIMFSCMYAAIMLEILTIYRKRIY